MTDFNWCHGPKCHTKHTVDRVRGVKGSKVLRTRKIPTRGRQELYWYDYFCSQNCYDNFANDYIQQIIKYNDIRQKYHDLTKTYVCCLKTNVSYNKKKHPTISRFSNFIPGTFTLKMRIGKYPYII